MAMERRDPVPVGRYWLYVKKEELGTWQDWAHANAPNVAVVATETQFATPDGWIWAATPEAALPGTDGIIKDARGEWILFDVRAPVPWVKLGLPTIVTDPNVRSTTDVITAPAPEGPSDPATEIRNLVLFAGVVYLLGAFIAKKAR